MLDDPENMAAVLSYILDSDKSAPIVYEHCKLGFCKVNTKMVFLADVVIECGKQSHYFEPKITAPCGTLDAWRTINHRENFMRSCYGLDLWVCRGRFRVD